MAQLCRAAALAALYASSVRAAYVEDSLDGNALLQVQGHGEVKSSIPERPTPVWVWEERGTKPTAIQQACESSWRRHAPARFFDIRFVNRQTISRWLPGLPSGFWRLPTEEAKSDVARAGLLAKHGGVYLDSDVLLRSELVDVLDRLDSADVVSFAANGQSCGKYALSPSFMVARNRSVLASRWFDKAVQLLTVTCTGDSKVCCRERWGELKQCRTVPRGLGDRLAHKALNEVLMEKPDLRVECFDHGKSQGLENCKAACLSQKPTKESMELTQRPGMAYKLFGDAPEQNVSRLDLAQLRQGSHLASELIRQSLSHTQELYLIDIPRTGGAAIEFLSRLEPYPEDRWGGLHPRLKGSHSVGHSGHSCSGQHVPPNLLPMWERRTTFCIVRNPLDRMVSEFRYSQSLRKEHSCDAETMNYELLQSLKAVLKGDVYHSDCHLLPQAAYVWSWDEREGRVDTSVQSCQKVLRFEQLERDFDALMASSGYPHRMEDVADAALPGEGICADLSVQDLSDNVKRLTKEVFQEDFRLLFQKGKLGDFHRK